MTVTIEIGDELAQLLVRIGLEGGIGDGVLRHALTDRHRGMHLRSHLATRIAIGEQAA